MINTAFAVANRTTVGALVDDELVTELVLNVEEAAGVVIADRVCGLSANSEAERNLCITWWIGHSSFDASGGWICSNNSPPEIVELSALLRVDFDSFGQSGVSDKLSGFK